MCQKTSAAWIAVVVIWIATIPSVWAGSIPATPFDLATAALMDDATATFDYLPRNFGLGKFPVHFASWVDPAGQSFWFTNIPGSTYNGQTLSISSSGIYNSAQTTWSFTTTAILGTTTLDNTGSLMYFDPPDIMISIDFSEALVQGIPEDLESLEIYTEDKNGKKIVIFGIYGHTVNGNPIPNDISTSEDEIIPTPFEDGWNIIFDHLPGSIIPPYIFVGSGSNNASTGIGQFTLQPAPEPASLTLLVAGVIPFAASWYRRRRRHD